MNNVFSIIDRFIVQHAIPLVNGPVLGPIARALDNVGRVVVTPFGLRKIWDYPSAYQTHSAPKSSSSEEASSEEYPSDNRAPSSLSVGVRFNSDSSENSSSEEYSATSNPGTALFKIEIGTKHIFHGRKPNKENIDPSNFYDKHAGQVVPKQKTEYTVDTKAIRNNAQTSSDKSRKYTQEETSPRESEAERFQRTLNNQLGSGYIPFGGKGYRLGEGEKKREKK